MECPNKCASVDVPSPTPCCIGAACSVSWRSRPRCWAFPASPARSKSWAWSTWTINMSPKGKQRCDNCRVWDPPNHCLSVDGEISPSGWCLIWRPQYKSQYAKVDADGKLTQGDVAYQGKPKGNQRCDNCRVFVAPDGCNSVQGKVSPAGWCNIWRKA